MIFGLGFATILTLFIVPNLYYLNEKVKSKIYKLFGVNYNPDKELKPAKKN